MVSSERLKLSCAICSSIPCAVQDGEEVGGCRTGMALRVGDVADRLQALLSAETVRFIPSLLVLIFYCSNICKH